MASDITQSSLNLTTEEKRVYGQLFQRADSDRLGVVPGDVAVTFFERTKLDSAVLAQIWQIADDQNRGLLTPAGFSVALRLIGHCQAGRSPSSELSKQPGPLPQFEPSGSSSAPPSAPTPAAPIGIQTTGPIRVPPLTHDKVNEFTLLFEKAGGRDGFLGGDAAKQMFERARLPNETLGRIWNLSDTEQRGALNLTEFIIAMHLITSMKAGTLRAVPQTLPSGLYEAATRRPPSAPVSGVIQPQFSGQGTQRAQSPLSRPPQFGTPPLSTQSTGDNFQPGDWLVSAADKSRFDSLFATIDKSRSGYINGEQAVQFFSTSGLSEDLLASIWDLADIRSEGQLNRDEFAVAMYLIREQRSRKDGRGNLPSILPLRLIPPSMRQRAIPPSQPTAPAFDNAVNAPQQPKSAADDLFGLDALSNTNDSATSQESATASPRSPRRAQPTGFSATSSTPTPGPSGGIFKPFIPASSFGQGLAQQNTGGSVQSNQPQSRGFTSQASDNDDLLGDNDPEISSRLTNESAELANMSNQIGTLRTQMVEVQKKKTTAQNGVSATSAQKQELETRLSQFRAQYESEIREVKALEERLTASRNDTKKLQQELAMVEGVHQDLQTQVQQISTALQADQVENTSLKEHISHLNAEIAQLRPQLEKIKLEARQLKGMVAINKKQLSTSEGDKEKLDRERAETEAEKTKLQEEIAAAETAKQAEASKQTSRTVSPAPVVSPAASIASQSTNPFFRASGGVAAGVMSPNNFQEAPLHQGSSAFDSFFGPSPTSQPSQPPPTTSFLPETPIDQIEKSQVSLPSEIPSFPEPPAPPESRQITSSALPLRMSSLRRDSFSSSVNAQPPLSRTGDSDVGTPTIFPGTPTESLAGEGDQIARPSAPNARLNEAAHHGFASSATRDLDGSDNADSFKEARETVPGAFPGDSSSASTPNTEESNSARQLQTEHILPGFAAPKDAFGGAHNEFPPIREFDEVDDEDSDSEDDAPTASSSTPHAQLTPAMTATTLVATTDTLGVPQSTVGEIDSEGEALPTPTRQMSPPSYDQSIPHGEVREPNQFPREYGGLLPSREIVDDPPTEVSQSPPLDLVGATNLPLRKGSLQSPGTSINQVEPVKSAPTDDFDSAFDDLSEAKEDDVPETFGMSTSQVDDYDFNPVFDSPAPSHTNATDLSRSTPTMSSRGLHQTTSSFDSAFGASALSTTKDFYTSQSAAATTTSQLPATTTSHDWDDLFSGLDNSTTAVNGSKDPFDLEEESKATGSTPVSAPTFSSALPEGSTVTAGGPSLSPYASHSSRQRPTAPSRGISTGTENDDPILTSLTSMGYPRAEALQALEKYDYNLDMAADYLTSKK